MEQVAYIYPVAKKHQFARGKVELQVKTRIGCDFSSDVIIKYFADRASAKIYAAMIGATPWNY